MKRNSIFLTGILILVSLQFGCKNDGQANKETSENKAAAIKESKEEALDKIIVENRKKLDKVNEQYPRLPLDGELCANGDNPLYSELKQRYKNQFITLKQSIESTGAKVIVVMLAPGLYDKNNPRDKYTIPFIRSTIEATGLEVFDFNPIFAAQDYKQISFLPKDAHFSKKGTKLIADNLVNLVKKYPDAACKVTYKDSERPETFGDLPPNDDEVLDGGKDLPYHVKANSQGLRLDHDLTFPKKKKRILLMGDSGIYGPFVDNDYTIAAMLQQDLPDYEVYAAAGINWTVDDFLSLWNDKTKYTEPDIVILSANGTDVEDYFFTNRNHRGRSGIAVYPSALEEKYYHETYK